MGNLPGPMFSISYVVQKRHIGNSPVAESANHALSIAKFNLEYLLWPFSFEVLQKTNYMKCLLSLLTIFMGTTCIAQFPVTLSAAHPYGNNSAKLECTSCTIRFLPSDSSYHLYPVVISPAYASSESRSEILISPPGVLISFFAEAGKNYLLRLNLNPIEARNIYVKGSSIITLPAVKSTGFLYQAESTGKLSFRVTSDPNRTWIFRSCTIDEIK